MTREHCKKYNGEPCERYFRLIDQKGSNVLCPEVKGVPYDWMDCTVLREKDPSTTLKSPHKGKGGLN